MVSLDQDALWTLSVSLVTLCDAGALGDCVVCVGVVRELRECAWSLTWSLTLRRSLSSVSSLACKFRKNSGTGFIYIFSE